MSSPLCLNQSVRSTPEAVIGALVRAEIHKCNKLTLRFVGQGQGGPKTRRFFVSESSNKILRHIRSKTWPEARPAARQKE